MQATFALASLGLLALVAALRADLLFNLPRQRPLAWALVLVLYPPLSALPQELVFRAFLSFLPKHGQDA
jgi:drug/metabolite transporter (DMT)-like permease